MDYNRISRSSYRALAAVCQDLPYPEIVNEVESVVGKGAGHLIKDILRFLILSMINMGIFNYLEPTLHICISGDGRNVEQKVKHVMVTFIILNKMNAFSSSLHFALLIYPGIENYNTLQVALAPLIAELHDIKTGFIDKDGFK
ncbi:30835_t:CDS:2, partial [Gigaspora margarita]